MQDERDVEATEPRVREARASLERTEAEMEIVDPEDGLAALLDEPERRAHREASPRKTEPSS